MSDIFSLSPITNSRQKKIGFTLIELLVVMGILGILAVLTLPAMSSLSNSGGVNRAASGIPLLLDQARAYAMAHNTYVWVGFAPDAASQKLVIGIVSGTTGDVSDLNSGNIVPTNKPQIYENLTLKSISGLEGMSTSASDIMTSKMGTFQQKAGGTPVVFTNVLQFCPGGEAMIDKTLGSAHWIQIGLQPIRGQNVSDPNVAVFQVAALTGQVQVFRP